MSTVAARPPKPVTAVVGSGSWGTALAMQLARVGCEVRLWGRDPDHVHQMAQERQNRRYLPDIPFPEKLVPQVDLAECVSGAPLVLVATPSHSFADMIARIRPHMDVAKGLCWASKGFEPGSGRFLHEVAQDLFGEDYPLAVATGPSFAREVAEDLPTALVAASTDQDYARLVAEALHGGNFRAYLSDDIVGAELGGAAKNVLAIGTGVCDGMGLGLNARAALITRGLAEITRLALALGGRQETLMGLSGMGDLVLTCTGDLSRNRRFGLALGKGLSVEEALAEIGQVVEGAKAAREVVRLGRQTGVEMPIAEHVSAVLDGDISPAEGVKRLMSRDLKREA